MCAASCDSLILSRRICRRATDGGDPDTDGADPDTDGGDHGDDVLRVLDQVEELRGCDKRHTACMLNRLGDLRL